MSRHELIAQARYQAAMKVAENMLSDGVITREEYDEIDRALLEKYDPFFSTLFSEMT